MGVSVVAGCDASLFLEFCEQVLDLAAMAVESRVVGGGIEEEVFGRWNRRIIQEPALVGTALRCPG